MSLQVYLLNGFRLADDKTSVLHLLVLQKPVLIHARRQEKIMKGKNFKNEYYTGCYRKGLCFATVSSQHLVKSPLAELSVVEWIFARSVLKCATSC